VHSVCSETPSQQQRAKGLLQHWPSWSQATPIAQQAAMGPASAMTHWPLMTQWQPGGIGPGSQLELTSPTATEPPETPLVSPHTPKLQTGSKPLPPEQALPQ
jgi:hypothetical protein